jgi:hypothetical protein
MLLATLEGQPCDGDGFVAADARTGTMRRTSGYAGKGDRVVAGEHFGPLRCVIAFDDHGSAQIWVRSDDIRFDRATTASDIDGRWQGITTDARIAIDGTAVHGEALWHGYGDNVHVGEFAGTGTPVDDLLTISDSICEVRMRRVGGYLVVDDNRECGGVNVGFAGVYQRTE